MLDLTALAEHYIPISIRWYDREGEMQNDKKAIEAVQSDRESPSGRTRQIRQWLQSYHVLQSFTSETDWKIAEQIIAYADERKQKALGLRRDLILEEFKNLESRIQRIVPAKKSGKPRKVTSLVSKALWCCYPSDIPIYDNYAEHALQVICRICDIRVTDAGSGTHAEFAHFLEAWFHLYGEIRPLIEQVDRPDYPYGIRVLDSLLWYIGQPKFGVI